MRKLFFAVSIYAAATLFSGCELETNDPFLRKQYTKRYTKDSLYKMHEHSPIHPNDRNKFINLDYFEPKKEYVVKAKYTEITPPQSIYIKDTEGMEQEYFRVGKVSFDLLGKSCNLSVYQNAEFINDPEKKDVLFLPFFDQTNGKETYPGGRYMDVKYVKDMQEVELDFNDAYNPHCAYSHDYKCPVPPAENKIPFRVEAGEKNFEFSIIF
ncbi:MAG: DUF1684 domain-containing protein [Bacteroidia bacterium]